MSTEKKVSDVSAVHQNQILREHYKKEMQAHRLNETFAAHPSKLSLVSDKPNKRGNRFLDKDEALLESFAKTLQEKNKHLLGLTDSLNETKKSVPEEQTLTEEDLKVKELMQTSKSVPKQRYDRPLTSAQEVGWFINNSSKSQFYRPKNSCDETKFADVLIRSSTIKQHEKATVTAKK